MTTAPSTENRTVVKASRDYLTKTEVDTLIAAAKKGARYGHRDALLIMMAYRHGLRASELCNLKWEQIDFSTARLHVSRIKNSDDSVHPIDGDELRALRALKRESECDFVFASERKGPISPDGFLKLVKRLGEKADFSFPIHPHMLRHACGYHLANKGIDTRAIQGYLGHKNIQNTVRYTKLSAERFKHFEKLF